MHTFLDNFHQGGKYSAQIASHQAELRKEQKFTDKNHWTSHPYILIILIWIEAHVLVEIVKDQTLFRQSAIFVQSD